MVNTERIGYPQWMVTLSGGGGGGGGGRGEGTPINWEEGNSQGIPINWGEGRGDTHQLGGGELTGDTHQLGGGERGYPSIGRRVTHRGYPSSSCINTQCLLKSTAAGTGKPRSCKAWGGGWLRGKVYTQLYDLTNT